MNLNKRIILLLSVLFVLSTILGIASAASLSQSDAQSLNSQIQNIQPTTIAIFLNNVKIALIEFIPILGTAFAAYTSYTTGLAISAIAGTHPESHVNGLESFLLLLLTPIYWLEFFSYSLAVEESISILISVRKKSFTKEEWKWLIGSIVVVVAVLFVSARLEASLVSLLG